MIPRLKVKPGQTRTLEQASMVPELVQALKDWAKECDAPCVLIGGFALSFYTQPRYTEDVDFLFLSDGAMPLMVPGFKKNRGHAFEHKATGVEIEIVTPTHVNDLSEAVAKKIFDTSVVHEGVRMASKEGLIASKLGRFWMKDQADIVELLKTGQVSLSDWPLTPTQFGNFHSLIGRN